jgi:hypothetical protein
VNETGYIHHARIDVGGPHPECGEVGRSVMDMARVDCPGCLQLDADRHARTEIHDGHAIPEGDEPDLVPSLVERVEQLERVVAEMREQRGKAAAHDDVMMPSEVTEMLGISGKTLVKWVRDGLISPIELPSGHRRYLRTEIESYFRQPSPKGTK